MVISCQFNTEQENKHDIHDHEYTIARSEW